MLTSLWFDTVVNKVSGLAIEISVILGQIIMIAAVWLLPPAATIAAAVACGCDVFVVVLCGSAWIVVWGFAWWFSARQDRRAKAGAAMREQNKLAVIT